MLNAPVKDIVILETLAEELAKVGVVRLVIESKCLRVVEENAECTQGAVVQQACGSTMLNALVEDMVALKTLMKEEVSKEPVASSIGLQLMGLRTKPNNDIESQMIKEWEWVWHLHPVTGMVVFFLLDHLSSASAHLLTHSGTTILWNTTLNTPAEDEVVLETLVNEEVAEEVAEVGVVRFVVEPKCLSVI
ncbi:hypothetical protein BKA82DRAFT_32104 [Pisolithus tinctorius]|uniref:Uncharacterized protein n=1 Tax=Pisolithus tinctorius Marx 270 TaxID=870435 RepID=A0A0C3IKX8_PISTI|nr:hypothetical protein BKA82DRAFT_32104 [Pisolithus tinctorius]KIN97632.1 hypothetical protein M404DRAFT_32104 [Pisolithus tinctorius Marx 270]